MKKILLLAFLSCLATGAWAQLSVTITGSSSGAPLAVTAPSATAIPCNGGTSTVSAIVTGGTPGAGYTATLKNSSNVTVGSPVTGVANGGTASFLGVPAGTGYTVAVTDNQTPTVCSVTSSSFSIAQPAAALAAAITSQTNVLCFGNSTGSATVTASNGTAGYTYVWTGGGTAATKSGLVAGSYTVTVTDANLCTTTATAVITQPAAALAATITSQTDVLCFGNSTGVVTVAATAATGTAPYQYQLGSGTFGVSGTFSSLAAGAYVVSTQDANGCQVTTNVTITQPAAGLSATIAVTSNYNGAQVSCNGSANGTATVTGVGGSGSYGYLWSNGATTANVTALGAATHTVTVTDGGSCSFTASVTVTQPAKVVAAASAITNDPCQVGAGAVTITITGGTGSYGLAWVPATGTPASPQSVVNGGNIAVGGLLGGNYTFTATDLNGCTNTP